MEPSATPVSRNPRMVLPVTGSPLHDSPMMTATMAATTTAPAMLRVRSRESACRISVTLNQLLSWPARRGRRRPWRGTPLPSDERSAVDAHGLARVQNHVPTGPKLCTDWLVLRMRYRGGLSQQPRPGGLSPGALTFAHPHIRLTAQNKNCMEEAPASMPSVRSGSASAGSPGADGVLIVGGGQAAMHLASLLREHGWQAAVTIVSEEARSPYQRPPLSKAFLSGNADPTTLEFRSAEQYERDRITVLTGRRVTDVQAAAAPGRRGAAITEGGDRLEFGHLALATGARPRLLAVPGADLAGICYLRDVGHALELRERLAAAQRVLVVGGGFIGLEAAASATAKGKTVTVVEAADRLIGRVVAPVISDFYAAAPRRRAVPVLLGTAVSRFEGTVLADTGPAGTAPANTGGTVTGAHLSDGSFVQADLVIIGIGAEPRTELAERLG